MFKPQPLMLVLLACVACGSSFEAGGSGGASGTTGSPQAGETGSGGDTSNGASAGQSSAGSDSAGEANSGGSATAGAGGAGHAGSSAGGTNAGGASAGTGTGGASAGNAAGGAAGADCAALKTEYAALVKKARVCDEGSTDECSTSSKAPPAGCGCPTLVNAKSQYTTLAAEKYKAIQKGGCDNGPICDIACPVATTASCAKTSGTGSSEFVCTGTLAVTN